MPRPHPVKVALAERGQTQRQLAAAVGVTPGTLAHVLNGRHASWPVLERRVAEYLGRPELELWPNPVERLLAERAAQGLPTTVEDAEAIRRVSALLAGRAS